MLYEVKFDYIISDVIWNLNGPEFKRGTPTFKWDEKSKEKRDKFARKYVSNFFHDLEESIKEKGIVDPIVISIGDFDDRYKKNFEFQTNENEFVCIGPGCSRLYIQQKVIKKPNNIPCIILDFNNSMKDSKLLNNEEEIIEKFKNKPSGINFHPTFIGLKGKIDWN